MSVSEQNLAGLLWERSKVKCSRTGQKGRYSKERKKQTNKERERK